MSNTGFAFINETNARYDYIEIVNADGQVVVSQEVDVASDEDLIEKVAGLGYVIEDIDADASDRRGLVFTATQRGRKATTEPAVRQPRDRRPARPAVKVEQSVEDLVEEIKAAYRTVDGQLIVKEDGRIDGVSGLLPSDDAVWVITGRYGIKDLVGDYLQHVDADFTEEMAYQALATDLLSPTAAWRSQMTYDLDSQLI